MKFGDWPQTVKDNSVTIKKQAFTRGSLTYHLGSDGNYCVEQSNKYYKVEPIVWRVLTENFVPTGKALLLAEKILTSGFQWDDDSNNYMESYIRRWLNGNSGVTKFSDYSGAPGFLQSAFPISAQDKIAETTVDNSKVSTNPDKSPTLWQNGENPYVCDDTTDKIFLLSQQEVTAADYGFAAYGVSGQGSIRIRVTTDYAKATGADQNTTPSYGGCWWLRSPSYSQVDAACRINYDGHAYGYNDFVSVTNNGVVPALSISLQ